jgi:hypothetical protein
MIVDLDDPAVRAITACDDGRCAWGLLMDHLGKIPKRQWREAREAIWSRRRNLMLKRQALRLLDAAAKGSSDDGIPVSD